MTGRLHPSALLIFRLAEPRPATRRLMIERLEVRHLLAGIQTAPDFFETTEDTSLTIPAEAGLLINDISLRDQAMIAIPVKQPRGNWTLLFDGSFVYHPPAEFSGLELASYQADDGTERSFETLVHLNVLPVNDTPISVDDSYYLPPGSSFAIGAASGILANDIDVDEDALTAELVAGPNHGSFELSADGSFVYQPHAEFSGKDSFQYRVTDGIEFGEITTVSLNVTATPIVINEFMASNTGYLETRTRSSAGDRFRSAATPDWIELHNRLDTTLSLDGFHLTDDPNNPTRWRFPETFEIPANGYLVVFASGQDIRDPTLDEHGWLHTDFQLSAIGEYLALTNQEGIVISELSGTYPQQKADISYGRDPITGAATYFATPTPGAANQDGRTDFAAAPIFSVSRGFYDTPFQLELTTPTSQASVRYTIDGSQPTINAGTLYTEPIRISSTTTLRAIAYGEQHIASEVETHTYLFLDDVLAQNQQPPDGYPESWGAGVTDWGMDQSPNDLAKIAGNEDLSLLESQQIIKESLQSLPTLSLVTSADAFFGERDGIYTNTQGRGERWERPVSVEFFTPDGSEPGFQINAGVRMQGFTSRDPNRNPKHSLRLIFRPRYGASHLEYPLFGTDGSDLFDTLVLRSNSQDAWVYDSAANRRGQFIRDEWARQTQLAMGQPGARGSWVHLYLNGLYWGVYNPTERPDATFASAHLGGSAADYDIVKNHEEFIDGDRDAYDELLAAIQKNPRNFSAGYRDLSDVANYQRIQGNNPDGSPNPEFANLLNVENLIDYIILGAYAAADDWPGNYYMGRSRLPDSQGFHFFMWDNEHGMKPNVRTNRAVPHRRDHDSPTKFYHALRSNDDFRLLFADRLEKAFGQGGPFYVDPTNPEWDPAHPERNVPASRWVALTNHIEQALIAEATRWGDVRRIQYTPHDQFRALREDLLQDWFPQRSKIVFDQFRRLNLYPDHQPPLFHHLGGQIPDGFELTLSNPDLEGDIYFSLDGSDPRNGSNPYVDPIRLQGQVTVRARVLKDHQWSALREATFTTLIPADPTNLRISEINYNPGTVSDEERNLGFDDNDEFEFIEFVNISNNTIDLRNVTLQQTQVAGRSEGVRFEFGASAITSLEPGDAFVVVENEAAFRARYGHTVKVAGQWQGKLSNGGETLSVRSLDTIIQEFSYSDNWHSATDGRGHTLEMIRPASSDLQAWKSAASWRASADQGGSPGHALPEPIPGDANGDLRFDSSDLVLVFQAGEYEDGVTGNSTFVEGDWNLDGDFDSTDLVFALTMTDFEF